MLSQDASQPLVASDRSPKRRRLEVASLGNRDVGHSDRYSQDASREALRPIEPSGSLSTARPSESIAHSAMNQAPSQEPQVLHQGPPSSEEWVCFGMINDLQFEPQLADIAEGSFAVEIDDIGQILTQANSVIGKFILLSRRLSFCSSKSKPAVLQKDNIECHYLWHIKSFRCSR
ncbi:hypothetical protein EV356DRAFT_286507 [Viridothelium virens]|uniref:Uncharacterized protein n=1 Tax=Viridothelium virens TaxID=1048519 RepID=A0A6A6H194_VIRVR|nr:hypothetical protein EV356DRAFT_286507 [Viridothelium virens]